MSRLTQRDRARPISREKLMCPPVVVLGRAIRPEESLFDLVHKSRFALLAPRWYERYGAELFFPGLCSRPHTVDSPSSSWAARALRLRWACCTVGLACLTRE